MSGAESFQVALLASVAILVLAAWWLRERQLCRPHRSIPPARAVPPPTAQGSAPGTGAEMSLHGPAAIDLRQASVLADLPPSADVIDLRVAPAGVEVQPTTVEHRLLPRRERVTPPDPPSATSRPPASSGSDDARLDNLLAQADLLRTGTAAPVGTAETSALSPGVTKGIEPVPSTSLARAWLTAELGIDDVNVGPALDALDDALVVQPHQRPGCRADEIAAETAAAALRAGRRAEALVLLAAVHAHRRRALGPSHDDTAASAAAWADVLAAPEPQREPEKLEGEALVTLLRLRREVRDHWLAAAHPGPAQQPDARLSSAQMRLDEAIAQVARATRPAAAHRSG